MSSNTSLKFNYKQYDNFLYNKFMGNKKDTMNSLCIEIPYSYIAKYVKLNWYDILFAVEHNFLKIESIREHALKVIAINPYCEAVIYELAIFFNDFYSDYDIINVVYKLSYKVSEEEKNEVQEKFLYVILSWLYDNKNNVTAPLEAIEIIYADFNYPNEIQELIRYMPNDDVNISSLKGNIGLENIYNKWRVYLNCRKEKYIGR